MGSGGRFIFLALFVCLSAGAAKKARTGCNASAARLPEQSTPTERFIALIENLVTKGALPQHAVEEIESSETRVNPADLARGLSGIPRHVFREAFAIVPLVDWPAVRNHLRDKVLPMVRSNSAERDAAYRSTRRRPVPFEIRKLDDVVSALKNATDEDHGISFVLDGKPWAVVRAQRGLLLVDISTGETKTLSDKPYYQTEEPVFFIHDGVPHLLTVEQIGQNQYVSDYDPRTGTVRRKFPKPGTFPLSSDGLAAAVVEGRPYALQGYSLSHYAHQPERQSSPGLWFTPLSPGAEPIRIETGKRFLDNPVVGTLAGRTLIGATGSDGRHLYFIDARDGHDVNTFNADTFGRYEASRAQKAIRFYESQGQPRAVVTTKTGFLVVDPIAGKRIAEIEVAQTDFSKDLAPVEIAGKPYFLTNGYKEIVLIDRDANKVETRIPFGAGSTDSLTARPQIYTQHGTTYVVWGSYGGNVYTAILPSGTIVSKQKLANHKIMDLHLSGLPDESKALIVPYGEPARLIDLLSEE